MYTLCLQRRFIANHYLIGGDWGRENEPHAHPYRIELRLTSGELDEHGYLIDLLDVETLLDGTIDRYRDRMLNDLPPFSGLNPSLERFCRILGEEMAPELLTQGVNSFAVRLWENEDAWAEWTGSTA